MTDMSVTWTDERVELLKKFWADGLSASQIANELGGVSRNAVIGKVHRLGLSGRGKTQNQSTPRSRSKSTQAAPSAPKAASDTGAPARMPQPPIRQPAVSGANALASVTALDPARAPEVRPLPAADAVVLPISERVTIMDLRDTMCRWPIGDPTSPDFRFCGSRSLTGLPYCEHHAQIAYQPAADRKRDRRLMRA